MSVTSTAGSIQHKDIPIGRAAELPRPSEFTKDYRPAPAPVASFQCHTAYYANLVSRRDKPSAGPVSGLTGRFVNLLECVFIGQFAELKLHPALCSEF